VAQEAAPTDGGKISDQDYFFSFASGKTEAERAVRLSNLSPGQYR
jgi:hypothetical protein